MQIFRRRLRSLTFIALFAMFGLALAPAVSHALSGLGAAGGFNPWAEICSASGATVNATAAGVGATGQPGKAASQHLEHCPLCGAAAQAPALPPADPAALPQPDGAHYVAARFVHAPRTLFAWAAAQPRGPPTVS